MSAPRKSVMWFARAMEKKLKANDHKGHWRHLEVGHLRRRLAQEIEELKRAIDANESPARVLLEAADAANFAMMIAENYRRDPR